MKTLQFKCTLLSDVILNKRAATTGPNETLDFIPGNNFLGIVASNLYPKLSAKDALTLFHSGKVRFGDAHPSKHGIRGLRVPAAMFFPKLGSADKELYIHHLLPEDAETASLQLKQCRQGFYVFHPKEETTIAELVATEKDFSIKSAYDREQRRSKDEQLFGYQSLRKGLVLYFSIEIDEDAVEKMPDIEQLITGAICGERQIGRSRSAQYGLLKIEKENYAEVESGLDSQERIVAVYADSRLIFLDDKGEPTLQPTARQLGLEGEVDWTKTQIRTFRYSPWNFKRQAFDTDRCGVEKGSVFIVKVAQESVNDLAPRYVGQYRNEGFGRVLYNPAFLTANKGGEAVYRLGKEIEDPKRGAHASFNLHTDTLLLRYLTTRKNEEEGSALYKMVNKFVETNGRLFAKREYASQWGTIRGMAAGAKDVAELESLLFSEISGAPGYLVHGVAKEKWEGLRLRKIREFISEAEEKLGGEKGVRAVVNLASEMAKLQNQDYGE